MAIRHACLSQETKILHYQRFSAFGSLVEFNSHNKPLHSIAATMTYNKPVHTATIMAYNYPAHSAFETTMAVGCIDDDQRSVISPLDCASIKSSPNHNPASDPQNTPFVPPPKEIIIRKEGQSSLLNLTAFSSPLVVQSQAPDDIDLRPASPKSFSPKVLSNVYEQESEIPSIPVGTKLQSPMRRHRKTPSGTPSMDSVMGEISSHTFPTISCSGSMFFLDDYEESDNPVLTQSLARLDLNETICKLSL
jgi:hypothetical protein